MKINKFVVFILLFVMVVLSDYSRLMVVLEETDPFILKIFGLASV